jgi:NADH:ubiquinone oxidoreductase subunit 6 (subunit J)
MSTAVESMDGKVAVRRARFREAVSRLSERAQSAELVRMLLLPGAFAVVGGFVFMFLGWYGAARTPRAIEQTPYLISGGFIGLALVFVGALLLACAFWMGMLQRFSEQADERLERRVIELEERLRDELRTRRAPSSRSVRRSSNGRRSPQRR